MSRFRFDLSHTSHSLSLPSSLPQSKALPEIIQELCGKWQLANSEIYALKSEDTLLYVTEKVKNWREREGGR